jgi:putative iron-dependent peroxidase
VTAPPPSSPSPSPEPQPIVTPLRTAAIFLVLTIDPGGEDTVRDFLEDVSGIQRAVGFRLPEADLSAVVGIGSDAWDRLFGGPRPAELHPFRELRGERHFAPATVGDLLFHLRADQMGLCFEFATQVMNRLAGVTTVQDEVQGFRYFDERDLMGFVDGTESPAGRAGEAAALVGAEDPDFTGGSYVTVQKYLHDMDSWNALSTEEQERVIGRLKLSDIEIPDDQKAPDSHVALNTIEDADGNERQILRSNMPFGSPGSQEYGTYYIGYAASASVTEQMLENMFIGDPPGNTDRILDFSTAETGTLFFAPSADFLDDLPAPPGSAAPAAAGADAARTPSAPGSAPAAPTPESSGSLGIGSLRRSTSP